MKADYDSQADAIAITVSDVTGVSDIARGDAVHERCTVLHLEGLPIDVELLYPGLGIEGPLAAAADRYDLDLEALSAAARSALAAPDRLITLEVAARA